MKRKSNIAITGFCIIAGIAAAAIAFWPILPRDDLDRTLLAQDEFVVGLLEVTEKDRFSSSSEMDPSKHRILKEVRVTGGDAKRIGKLLVEARRPDDEMSKCIPVFGVSIKAGDRIEVYLCLDCGIYSMYQDDGPDRDFEPEPMRALLSKYIPEIANAE